MWISLNARSASTNFGTRPKRVGSEVSCSNPEGWRESEEGAEWIERERENNIALLKRCAHIETILGKLCMSFITCNKVTNVHVIQYY